MFTHANYNKLIYNNIYSFLESQRSHQANQHKLLKYKDIHLYQ